MATPPPIILEAGHWQTARRSNTPRRTNGSSSIRRDTIFLESIPAQERLALTLRFLATGDTYVSLQYLFKICKQSISRIIPYRHTQELHSGTITGLPTIPKTQDEWLHVSNDFETTWTFPHCVGAVDGKHIILQCPINSGSEYINYKGFFSIVLFAVVDASYNFIFVDVGCQGRISDGGVFASICLYKEMGKQNAEHPSPCSSQWESTKNTVFFSWR
ncbi:unnamed protein product [Acanthoscelides obtectus]|uniref:DDE Tnp4 domain-containing protein n=1 Tax=Acanthoscelides obtectus TaxID=200917 RepID=A0A9P0KPR5_ACAOB|nr:unnamed protein product [Acanthoscelides obtectus]CAK1670208.1 Protein ANTAGONIST OF LIKE HETEROCHROMATIN PROTEIN 1 [Acanthoscelides obtectus]